MDRHEECCSWTYRFLNVSSPTLTLQILKQDQTAVQGGIDKGCYWYAGPCFSQRTGRHAYSPSGSSHSSFKQLDRRECTPCPVRSKWHAEYDQQLYD
jgi:hypothetical protein